MGCRTPTRLTRGLGRCGRNAGRLDLGGPLHYVLEGAKMFKLPQAYIESVIVPVEAKEAPEPAE
jgi:hypothetical protein